MRSQSFSRSTRAGIAIESGYWGSPGSESALGARSPRQNRPRRPYPGESGFLCFFSGVTGFCVKFKKGDTIIYPQHGACIVMGTKKMDAFGEKREYLILQTVINEMTLKVPVNMADEVGVRPPVSADELEDLVAVLSKPDPRVPSNWSRRFKNHQEKLKSGDVYQVAEVVRNLAARNRDASLSAAERTMYERARVNLVSEISPALKVSAEEAEEYLDAALAKGVLKPAKAAAVVKKK